MGGYAVHRRVGLTILAFVMMLSGVARADDTELVTVNAAQQTRPFPHFWEHTFGSGRAVLSLRQSYRDDLRTVKGVTAVGYVRFHAILHDEVGVYSEDATGRPLYNFS